MKSAIFIVAATLTTACVPITEEQRDAREYRDAEWRAEFIEYRAKCRNQGGNLMVRGDTQRYGRHGVPDYGDFYTCRRSMAFR